MEIADVNRAFLARDAYFEWKRRVSEAEDCITVYSPFFDGMLLSLLSETHLDKNDISIVTDLIPESILELPGQLMSIKRALSEGIPVLALPRLHAKVLLTDDKFVTTGSQNFTSYGRKSKECTVVPSISVEDSEFIDTLIRWREEATPIDEDLIDTLISELSPNIKQHKKLIDETRTEFQRILEEHNRKVEEKERKKKEARIRILEELERKSSIRMSHGPVKATIKELHDQWGANYYDSLIADPGSDLTSWIIQDPDGTTRPYRLDRLSMYPMLIADNYRMGFARIGKTRITYIRDRINWSGRPFPVGRINFDVTISFPPTDTEKRNITVKLNHSWGSCELDILFTGKEARLINKKYHERKARHIKYDLLIKTIEEQRLFESSRELNRFFVLFFTKFKFKELNIKNKSVRQYLQGQRFRLSIIQFGLNPFLVVNKIY